MRPLHAVLVAVGLAAAAVGPTVATTWLAPVTPAAAEPGECQIRDAGGQCVVTNQRPTPGGTGASSRGPLTCTWVGFADQAYGLTLFPPPENTLAHGGGAIVFHDCGRPQGNGEYDPWERVGANGTLGDGSANLGHIDRAVVWDDPAEIAEDATAQVIANLPPPVPVISPPPGGAAIIDQPTFVAVGNWPGIIGPLEAHDGPVRVEITAVPTLVFTPGDGADPIACTGAGTEFDARPEAPEPAVQAEGACAHVYDHRTSGESWPGRVAIHWEVTWTSETPDDDGVIDVVPQGVPVPRQVDEIQAIIVDPDVEGDR